MALFRTSNPALKDNTFTSQGMVDSSEAMTLGGTAEKSAALLFLVVAAAAFTWNYATHLESNPILFPILIGSLILSFILGLVIIFVKTTAPYLSPLYALAEGCLLGAISAFYEMQFHGIVFQAVALTFGTMATLLFLYRARIVRATENFKLGVLAATGGIAIYYLVDMVMGFFGRSAPLIDSATPMGIGFSVVVVIVAALNLVLDFDFIERGVEARAPKYMEWYAAFGLLVTLVWLYLEILRLLSKTRRR
ncbi:MAG TPA: Bax inhibitor-1/YccA family protein [bacterium]|nr:Bax inhibitor-1/YccA family protein [bacterium]